MKKELKEKINIMLEKRNMNYLKSVLAFLYNLKEIDSEKWLYILYDRYMFHCNVDLYYLVSLSDDWDIELESDWYATSDSLKEAYKENRIQNIGKVAI